MVAEVEVWWIPQVRFDGAEPFRVPVTTIGEGKLLCDALAAYDAYQFEHKIKPDYCNAGGLRIRLPGEDWEDVDPDDEDELEYARARLLG